jgi:hypothetical protein
MTTNYEYFKKQLLLHFDIVFEEITNRNLEIKTISVMLRDKQFNTHIFKIKLNEYTNIRKIIQDQALNLLKINYSPNMICRSV